MGDLVFIIGGLAFMLGLLALAGWLWRRSADQTDVATTTPGVEDDKLPPTQVLANEVAPTQVLPAEPERTEVVTGLRRETPGEDNDDGTVFAPRPAASPGDADATARLGADELFGDRGGWKRADESR